MDKVRSILKFFEGKKTYIVGILTIILGFLNSDNAMIMSGLGMLTLRGAIKAL